MLNNLWKYATLKDCKKDAKTTSQFVYRLGNKLVGFVTCSLKKENVAGCKTHNVAYLEGIYVLSEYRNKNIASQLENRFELWAKSKGCKELASDLEVDNKTSLQFHNKMGFEIVETAIHLKKDI